MSFAETVAADRRLVILRLLQEGPGFRLNNSVIHSALTEVGHAASKDQVLGDLAWLAEQELVTTDSALGGKVTVATLTDRGADVAAGRATVPGVKRPSPGGV